MRRCSRCQITKALTEFSGDTYWCKPCRAQVARERRALGKGGARDYEAAYRARTPRPSRAAEYRDSNRKSKAEFRARCKAAVFARYGSACACCGSTERLTIDHVNGDGKAMRLVHGRGTDFYAWLFRNGFPAAFQTLCWPCNYSKGTGLLCRIDHNEERAAECAPTHRQP